MGKTANPVVSTIKPLRLRHGAVYSAGVISAKTATIGFLPYSGIPYNIPKGERGIVTGSDESEEYYLAKFNSLDDYGRPGSEMLWVKASDFKIERPLKKGALRGSRGSKLNPAEATSEERAEARRSFEAAWAKVYGSRPETVSIAKPQKPIEATSTLSKAEARKIARMTDKELADYNARVAKRVARAARNPAGTSNPRFYHKPEAFEVGDWVAVAKKGVSRYQKGTVVGIVPGTRTTGYYPKYRVQTGDGKVSVHYGIGIASDRPPRILAEANPAGTTSTGRKYMHEHLAAKPEGATVRTIKQDGHLLRVAYWDGAGRGQHKHYKLLSVLHPIGEKNPCTIRIKG